MCLKILKVEHSFQKSQRQISGYILREQKYIKISFYCFPKAITMLTRHKACTVLAECTAVFTEPPPKVFTPSARAERTRVCRCCHYLRLLGVNALSTARKHPTPDRLPSRRGILNDLRVSVPSSHMAGAGPVRPFHPNVSSPLPRAFRGG